MAAKKTNKISVYLTDQELKDLNEVVDETGLSVSAFVTQLIKKSFKKK